VATGGDAAEHDAILLRSADSASVLVEPGIFLGVAECKLAFDKRWHNVRLEHSVERGFDYERIEITFL
jgi:hypothetical protein